MKFQNYEFYEGFYFVNSYLHIIDWECENHYKGFTGAFKFIKKNKTYDKFLFLKYKIDEYQFNECDFKFHFLFQYCLPLNASSMTS